MLGPSLPTPSEPGRAWPSSTPIPRRAERLAYRLLLSWLVAVCALASPAALPAQTVAPSERILLTVAAPADEAAQLDAVARELLARLEVQLELRRVQRLDLGEIRRAAPGHAYFARVWIAFAPSGRARLYLEHAESNRVLVRDVAADSSNPELVREELGHILQAAIEGLKAGEQIGAPREEALQQVEAEDAGATAAAPRGPEKPVEPLATPVPRRQSFRFGPRYEAVWLGDASRFEDGPGAVFGWVKSGSRLGFELAGYYRRPLELSANPVGARLQTLALRALVTFDAWRGQRSVLRLAAGPGADLVRVSPLASSGSNIELARSSWLKLALGRVGVSYEHRLASFVAVELNFGADIDPARTRYVYRQGDGDAAVLEPWPVRPLLSLGATVP
jgi:hypothetical protein